MIVRKIMKIAIGSDHGGYLLKTHIKKLLESKNYSVIDFGTNNKDSVDYPDYGYMVAKSVQSKESDYGIAICTTGIGMSIVANKVNGIRSSLVMNVEDAILAKEHNNANVLALGAKYISEKSADDIVIAWLNTSFSKGRHQKRVNKINEIEEKE